MPYLSNHPIAEILVGHEGISGLYCHLVNYLCPNHIPSTHGLAGGLALNATHPDGQNDVFHKLLDPPAENPESGFVRGTLLLFSCVNRVEMYRFFSTTST